MLVDFIDEQILSEILALFSHKDVLIGRLQKDLLSAAYVLSVQLLNSSFSALNELRFFREDLAQLSEFQLEGMLRNQLEKGEMFAPEKALELLKVIEEHTDSLYESMHSRGVKIELVYLFENQKRKIRRLRSLLLFAHADPVARARNFRYFISHLILDIHHQSSLKSFLSENFALLTDRIVQANSTVGEHYVTHTWLQFKRMFRSALGGGAITAGTVIMKVLIGKIGLVGFLKGLFDSFNYAGSFLAIQMMGWTLATKQPSATAPYIASALQKSISDARRAIVAVLRTQFIAVWGNLSMVFPVCLFLSWGTYYFGMPILTAEEAMYLFDSTSLLGPSALFAAFTGVLLFTASLIAGWFENWVIVNQIENRIKNNERFYRLFGAKLVQKISSVVGQKSNAIAANISLGFLLGMVPQFLKFMNLPLDVRHVTLAMGGFASSLPIVIDLGVSIPEILSSLLGIFLIGLLNISVSFSLAFLLASISSKVRFSSFVHLFKWGVKLFITRPWLLVVPEDRNSEKHSG